MALQNFAPDQEPQTVELSPDFDSLLAVVDSENKPTTRELIARLNAVGGFARINGQRIIDADGQFLREDRVLTRDQQVAIRQETETFDEISLGAKQAKDFESFCADLLDATIISAAELNGRLNPTPSGRVPIRSSFLRSGNDDVIETRSVNSEQAAGVQRVFEVLNTTQETLSQSISAASFARDIVSGAIKSGLELNGRLNPTPSGRVPIRSSFLRSGNDDVIETRSVTPEQTEIIRNLFNENETIRRFTEQTKDFDSFLKDILAGRIKNIDELNGRLNPTPSGRVPIRSSFLRSGNDDVIETRSVTPEQTAELIAAWRSVNELDEALIESLLDCAVKDTGFDTPNQEMDIRLQSSLSGTDAEQRKATTVLVNGLVKTIKRNSIANKVAQLVAEQPDNLEAVQEAVASSDILTLEDRTYGESLIAVGYKARRVAFTVETLSAISGATNRESFTAILSSLEEYRESSSPFDTAQAERLTDQCYLRELACSQRLLLNAALIGEDKIGNLNRIVSELGSREDSERIAYFKRLEDAQAVARGLAVIGNKAEISKQLAGIAGRFKSENASTILALIEDLPAEDETDFALQASMAGFFKQYLVNRRERRADDFRNVFAFEIEALRKTLNPDFEFDAGLGRNLEALKALSAKFKEVLLPLFQSLRSDEAYSKVFSEVVAAGVAGSEFRNRYIQRVSRLGEQRELTDIEKNYLDSVELLTLFNPYIASLINADPAITQVYLESYFNQTSNQTWEAIQEDELVPLLQVGLGPNGLAAAGEVFRCRPDLAQNTLYIDESDLPGGPFAVPKGPAWELNSANSRGLLEPTLPPLSEDVEEIKTIRAYGSPLRWYPGERLNGNSIRQGSINSTVDWLITPDGISDGRYPDNEDMAIVEQTQAALLADKLSLKTQVVKVEPAPEEGFPNRMRVTLNKQVSPQSSEQKTVRVDNLIISSGLGQPNYGFRLAGSNAERILDQTKELEGFPKLSTTLEAFEAFASREGAEKVPGQNLLIYGNGNSADTLVEYVAGLFDGSNKSVRNVEKVYVVSTGGLSNRPRYAAISDVKPRNGRGNLVEFINARVADIAFTRGTDELKNRKLVLVDDSGRALRDNEGRQIAVDNVIAATGFTPKIDDVLAPITGGRSVRTEGVLQPLVLPTNSAIPVADKVAGNDRILIIGTGSKPNFDNPEKLRQLPASARQALLRNGSENAVAIGFRAPDSQAAVRLFLEGVPKGAPTVSTKKPSTIIPLPGAPSQLLGKPIDSPIGQKSTRRDMSRESSVLTPIMLRNLTDLQFSDSQAVDGKILQFTVQRDGAEGFFLANPENYSEELVDKIALACSDPYFQAYANKAVSSRRGSTSLVVELVIKNKKIDLRNSFVQAV